MSNEDAQRWLEESMRAGDTKARKKQRRKKSRTPDLSFPMAQLSRYRSILVDVLADRDFGRRDLQTKGLEDVGAGSDRQTFPTVEKAVCRQGLELGRK